MVLSTSDTVKTEYIGCDKHQCFKHYKICETCRKRKTCEQFRNFKEAKDEKENN
jgi:hypothetical protein